MGVYDQGINTDGGLRLTESKDRLHSIRSRAMARRLHDLPPAVLVLRVYMITHHAYMTTHQLY